MAANSVPIIALAPIANGMFSITSPVSKMAVVGVVAAGLTHHERGAWCCPLVVAAMGVALLVERGQALA